MQLHLKGMKVSLDLGIPKILYMKILFCVELPIYKKKRGYKINPWGQYVGRSLIQIQYPKRE